jgi:hypothetical protein
VKKERLFVWTGFCPDYAGGLAFAIAIDETEARDLVTKEYSPHRIYEWGDLHIHDLSESIAYAVSGGA